MARFASQISFVLLFLLFATTFNRSAVSLNSVIRCNENDQSLLLIFKQGVVDPNNQLSSWTVEEDCCSWEGVWCDNMTGRVTKVDLAFHELRGQINLCLLQLEFLNHLNLSYNYFEIVSMPPCQISKYPLVAHKFDNKSLATPNQSASFSCALHYLDFSSNGLVINDLHWLSQLSSLQYLDLSYCDIGKDTKWLQYMAMLPSLSELHLRLCGLRHFPSMDYVNFTSLKVLDLSSNNIYSKLPNSFFNITNLIYHLDLSNCNIYGQVPKALFNLQNLRHLDLSSNNLEGSIPNSFCRHEQLQYFQISSNLFSASIPSCLGNLSSLISLDLSNNHFIGNFPESLGQLQKLSYLNIEGNSWVGVLSEKNFANLSSLTSLDLSSIGFKFDFDLKWVPPFQLETLYMGNTSIGPNVPIWLYTQQSLKYLDISISGISTVATDAFWNFVARIDYIDLSNNLMSGDISNVTLYSKYIYLEYNNFTGGLPHISANVSEFHASHNSFSGSIFPLLCHPQSNGENMLSSLDLSYNHLTGILPNCWANWKQLEYLTLGSNKLAGKIPPSLASLNLYSLDLSDNDFFGKFSSDMLNWTNMQYLFLEQNNFSGFLPNLVAQYLVVIKLRTNQFIGNIPLQLCNLSTLIMLDLAENKLSGSIPHCLHNISYSYHVTNWPAAMMHIFTKGRELDYQSYRFAELRTGIIDLSANSLSGEIPKELLSISKMHSLNLSRNHLIGKIPKEIGGMKNLESLDLSNNRLSGEIPSTISNLSFLAYLNLSYNNFIGQIPLGTQIQSFDSWSFVGNPKLCGDPLPNKCNKKEETHDSKLAEGNEDDNFLKSLYLGMGVGFTAGFWGVCGSLFLVKAWRHKFFAWFDHMVEQLYVALALCYKSFGY